MNNFYTKPKPETMKKNREVYVDVFEKEIKWLKSNLQTLTLTKNKFMIDIRNGVQRCKSSPRFNPELQTEAEAKLQPILEKIAIVERLAESKNDKGLEFIQNVKQYVKTNYRVTKKQMEALNKVYKRCGEDLFKDE